MFTNDPIADFHSYDSEKERQLDKLPECSWCGNKIQDDYLWEICDETYCEECAENLFRKDAGNFKR